MRVKNPVASLSRILVDKAPVEAQLIVTRRCNLSCGYCSEFDNVSKPVDFALLRERIDALHRLKVVNVAILGGEPLLHPKIAEIVAYTNRAAQVSITTNGFLLSDELVDALNEAGLANMQISIDTLNPDPSGFIQKSFKSIAPKLERVRQRARFDVHATVVLCEQSKEEFPAILRELRRLGILVSVNLVHDRLGACEISGDDYVALWEGHFEEGSPFSFIEQEYGRRLLAGERPAWTCRAGARFLYVDEHGNAQFCSSQMGRLGKPITAYTRADILEHARTEKGCESGCSLFCVYRISQVDNAPVDLARSMWRAWRRGSLTGAPRDVAPHAPRTRPSLELRG